MNSITHLIGWLLAVGTLLGIIIAFGVCLFIMFLPKEPQFKDEHDYEIYEHQYWKKKNKT